VRDALCSGAGRAGAGREADCAQAVTAELAANRDDQSHWRYLRSEAGGNSFIVVETEHGAIGRHVEEKDRPARQRCWRRTTRTILSSSTIRDAAEAEAEREHDDKSAVELMNCCRSVSVERGERDAGDDDAQLQPDPTSIRRTWRRA